MIRLIYSIPIWTLFITLRTVLIIIGWPLIFLALACDAYRVFPNVDTGKNNGWSLVHFTWPFMWLWDNEDDGIYCKTYFDHGFFWTCFRWSAIRNPVNNLRFVRWLSCLVNPLKIRFFGSLDGQRVDYNKILISTSAYEKRVRMYDTKIPQWFFCYQGLYSCFYWQFVLRGELRRFWVGNAKLYPTDIFGGPYGYREKGAGMVTQFKKV